MTHLTSLVAALRSPQMTAISTQMAGSSLSLLAALVHAVLEGGQGCALLSPLSLESFLQRSPSRYRAALEEAVCTGSLVHLNMARDCRSSLLQHGTARLIAELDSAITAENTVIVVDQAEELFTLHHPETSLHQCRSYASWLHQTARTGLFVFSKAAEEAGAASGYGTIRTCMDASATVESRLGGIDLRFDFLPLALEGQIAVPVELPATGSGPIRGDTPGVFTLPAADDVQLVYCLGLPADLPAMDAELVQVRSPEALIHATRYAVQASVLIGMETGSAWIDIAQAIYTMRSRCGGHLHIAVIDLNGGVRYQTEALLLQCGANLIARLNGHLDRLPLVLHSLRRQRYGSPVSLAWEEAIASAVPKTFHGRLPPKTFRQEALDALLRARTLNVPCALVTFSHLAWDTAGIESQLRQGDFYTSTAAGCHLFLYGCTPLAVDRLAVRLAAINSQTVWEAATQEDDIRRRTARIADHQDDTALDAGSLLQDHAGATHPLLHIVRAK